MSAPSGIAARPRDWRRVLAHCYGTEQALGPWLDGLRDRVDQLFGFGMGVSLLLRPRTYPVEDHGYFTTSTDPKLVEVTQSESEAFIREFPGEFMKMAKSITPFRCFEDFPFWRGRGLRMQEAGIAENVGWSIGGEQVGLTAVVSSPHPVRAFSPAESAAFVRLGFHIGAGFRVRFGRRAMSYVIDPRARSVDAVGPVDEARTGARPNEEGPRLLAESLRLDPLRVEALSREPVDPLVLWRGLSLGRFSLVETVERDGRRLILVKENAPEVFGLVALSPREEQVATLIAAGHSQKATSYALGISTASVSTHLWSAMQKVGISNRTEFVGLISTLLHARVGGPPPTDAAAPS